MKVMLKGKIIGLVFIAAILPVLTMLIIAGILNWRISNIVTREMNVLSNDNIAQIASDVRGLCNTTNDLIKQQVNYSLKVARKMLDVKGGISFTENKVKWKAVNQYNKELVEVSLNKMMLGKLWFGINSDFNIQTPLVDEVKELVGGTCTVFQRMENNDMLRIATNVENLDKSRAIGTFIPAVNPDGEENPVVSTVLQGKTYYGRAYVVNTWYITAYEPIIDKKEEVVGILYVGIKQEAVKSLRKAIYNMSVGKNGYVYVLGGKGSHRGHYIISKDGIRDGEDILNSVDSDGRYFIKAIINKALTLKGEEVGFMTYPWKNLGEKKTRNKIAAIQYFQPWDWVIGVGMYADDFYDVKRETEAALNSQFIFAFLGGVLVLIVAVFLAVLLGNKITKPISEIINIAKEIAKGNLYKAKEAIALILKDDELCEDNIQGDETQHLLFATHGMTQNLNSLIGQVQKSGIQVTTSTTQIAASARQLEATISEQAASTREVLSTSENISSTSKDLVKTMNDVNEVAGDTTTLADKGKKDLVLMESAIMQLMDATTSISSKLSIIKEKTNNIDSVIVTINKVADQTNLLSLNAAIEAEKAGEYGIGFSVVAREIRRLADQTAVSTLDIENMVKEMQTAVTSGVMEMEKFSSEVKQGVENTANVSHQLELIIEQVKDLTPRFDQVNDGMQFQSQSAQQITETMTQLNEAISQTSDSLTEFNNATDQLNDAANGLQSEVSKFKVSQ